MGITVVTGCTKSHVRCVQNLMESASDFDYDFLVYDYDGTAHGIPFHIDFHSYKKYGRPAYHPKISAKPDVLIDAIERVHGDMIYMDSDTEFVCPVDEVFEYNPDFDIAVTIHDHNHFDYRKKFNQYPEMSSYLNAGVLFFRNTGGARRFLRRWKAEVKRCDTHSDQHALTNILRNHISFPYLWNHNYRHDCKGTLVKLLISEIYNFDPNYMKKGGWAKIIHNIGRYECVDS